MEKPQRLFMTLPSISERRKTWRVSGGVFRRG